MCNTDQCGREIILRSISQFENSVWNSGAISNTKELDRSWIDPFPKSQYSKPNTNVILYVSSSGKTILLCIGFSYHILGFKQHSEQDRSKIDPLKKVVFWTLVGQSWTRYLLKKSTTVSQDHLDYKSWPSEFFWKKSARAIYFGVRVQSQAPECFYSRVRVKSSTPRAFSPRACGGFLRVTISRVLKSRSKSFVEDPWWGWCNYAFWRDC